jgi:hypothetical protein
MLDISANSAIREGLVQLERARRKRLWLDYVNQLISLTPQFEAAAKAVDEHWFSLDPQIQRALVEMRRDFQKAMQAVAEQHNTLLKRIWLGFHAGWLMARHPELVSPTNARVRLFAAIDRALEREKARRLKMDADIESDADMIASRKRGEEQLRARITHRISRDDFDRRLKSS